MLHTIRLHQLMLGQAKREDKPELLPLATDVARKTCSWDCQTHQTINMSVAAPPSCYMQSGATHVLGTVHV
jgi:hypothetical protein